MTYVSQGHRHKEICVLTQREETKKKRHEYRSRTKRKFQLLVECVIRAVVKRQHTQHARSAT